MKTLIGAVTLIETILPDLSATGDGAPKSNTSRVYICRFYSSERQSLSSLQTNCTSVSVRLL